MDLKIISPKQLQQKIREDQQVLILDVRATEKYENNHIEGGNIKSVNIPKDLIFNLNEDFLKDLPKTQEIVVTCTTGNSAKKCAAILKENQYDVTVLEGGITAWNTSDE